MTRDPTAEWHGFLEMWEDHAELREMLARTRPDLVAIYVTPEIVEAADREEQMAWLVRRTDRSVLATYMTPEMLDRAHDAALAEAADPHGLMAYPMHRADSSSGVRG